jgi:hypothetical protein
MVELHSGPLNRLATIINEAVRVAKANLYPVLLAFAVIYLFREPGQSKSSTAVFLGEAFFRSRIQRFLAIKSFGYLPA